MIFVGVYTRALYGPEALGPTRLGPMNTWPEPGPNPAQATIFFSISPSSTRVRLNLFISPNTVRTRQKLAVFDEGLQS